MMSEHSRSIRRSRNIKRRRGAHLSLPVIKEGGRRRKFGYRKLCTWNQPCKIEIWEAVDCQRWPKSTWGRGEASCLWSNMKDIYENVYSIQYSKAVTHSSTDWPRRCLTSVIGREPVFSTWYGRRQSFSEGAIYCLYFLIHYLSLLVPVTVLFSFLCAHLLSLSMHTEPNLLHEKTRRSVPD